MVLTKTGQYKIGCMPCAMWHQYGHVTICTSDETK